MNPRHPVHAPNDAGEPRAPLAVNRREAAAMLGISERLLWEFTKLGKIPHARVGTRVLYPVAKLSEWLDEQSRNPLARN